MEKTALKMIANCNLPANKLTNDQLECIFLIRKLLELNVHNGEVVHFFGHISDEEKATIANKLGIAI